MKDGACRNTSSSRRRSASAAASNRSRSARASHCAVTSSSVPIHSRTEPLRPPTGMPRARTCRQPPWRPRTRYWASYVELVSRAAVQDSIVATRSSGWTTSSQARSLANWSAMDCPVSSSHHCLDRSKSLPSPLGAHDQTVWLVALMSALYRCSLWSKASNCPGSAQGACLPGFGCFSHLAPITRQLRYGLARSNLVIRKKHGHFTKEIVGPRRSCKSRATNRPIWLTVVEGFFVPLTGPTACELAVSSYRAVKAASINAATLGTWLSRTCDLWTALAAAKPGRKSLNYWGPENES